MRSRTIVFSMALAVSMLCFTGCDNTQDIDLTSGNSSPHESGTSPTVQPQPSSKENEPSTKGTDDLTYILGGKSPDSPHVQYIDQNTVLYASDKLYLYDISKETMIAEAPLSDSPFRSIHVLKNHFGVIEQVLGNEGSEVSMNGEIPPISLYLYDENLKVAATLDLSEIFDTGGSLLPESFALSQDGSKVACFLYGKLLLYDIQTNAKEEILDLSANAAKGIYHLNNLAFANNDQSLAFYGSEALDANTRKPVFGVADSNGKNLTYYQNENIDDAIQPTAQFVFFDENNVEFGKSSHGEVYSIDYSARKLKTYQLTDLNESQQAYASSGGKYFVTVLSDKQDGDHPIYRFRVYDTASMEVLKEMDVPFRDKSFTESGIFGMTICEENRSFITTYSLDGQLHIYRYYF